METLRDATEDRMHRIECLGDDDPVRRRMRQVHGKLEQLMALQGLSRLQETARTLIGLNGDHAVPSIEVFETTWSGLKRTEKGKVEDRVNKALRAAQNRNASPHS